MGAAPAGVPLEERPRERPTAVRAVAAAEALSICVPLEVSMSVPVTACRCGAEALEQAVPPMARIVLEEPGLEAMDLFVSRAEPVEHLSA